jgi:hypothetical protein
MVIVRATKSSEAGVLPSEELLNAMESACLNLQREGGIHQCRPAIYGNQLVGDPIGLFRAQQSNLWRACF